jgi:ribosomal protein S21
LGSIKIRGKMQVKRRKSESSENLIKRFIRKVKKEKIVEEFLDRRYFKKPSQVKREEKARRDAENEKVKQKEKREREG